MAYASSIYLSAIDYVAAANKLCWSLGCVLHAVTVVERCPSRRSFGDI